MSLKPKCRAAASITHSIGSWSCPVGALSSAWSPPHSSLLASATTIPHYSLAVARLRTLRHAATAGLHRLPSRTHLIGPAWLALTAEGFACALSMSVARMQWVRASPASLAPASSSAVLSSCRVRKKRNKTPSSSIFCSQTGKKCSSATYKRWHLKHRRPDSRPKNVTETQRANNNKVQDKLFFPSYLLINPSRLSAEADFHFYFLLSPTAGSPGDFQTRALCNLAQHFPHSCHWIKFSKEQRQRG